MLMLTLKLTHARWQLAERLGVPVAGVKNFIASEAIAKSGCNSEAEVQGTCSTIHARSAQVAERLGVPVAEVKNVIIWGNHSSSQYPVHMPVTWKQHAQ
jgi:hypothetical protein